MSGFYNKSNIKILWILGKQKRDIVLLYCELNSVIAHYYNTLLETDWFTLETYIS